MAFARRFTVLLATSLLLIPVRVGAQPPQTPSPAVAATPYRLEAGDSLEIKFFYNPELNEQAQIRPDGRLSFPLIGDLQVVGMAVQDLATELERRYAADVKVKNPALTIQVRSYANRRVFVGGEVARASMIPLTGTQTALGAIAEAGGLKPSANRNEIVVLRRSAGGTPETIRLGLKASDGAPPQAAAFELQSLDVVLVMESGISRANRAMDQYVRQMMPFLVTAGFTYIFNGAVLGVK